MLYTTPTGQTYTLFKDMLSQPHLLVAGATGSGKSVVVNGLIATALYRFPGDGEGAAQFILIDPKRVELSLYRQTPHCIMYASEPSEFVPALEYAVSITETRYKAMQRDGVRKYQGGNVYVIIDEFADLVTTQGRAVKPLIQRLAQIGRAARVHIILATQTPIAKVLPTEIKCNFDSRVGLRTRSAQDSRNILGRAGLEDLPRYGQGVYSTPEGEALYRIPYIQDAELERLVTWWTSQNRPQQFRKKGLFSRIFK